MGTFDRRQAIRGFLADWIGSFDDLTMEADEIVGFRNAVVLTVYHQKGRPRGGSNYVRVRSAVVAEWLDGMIARSTIYTEAEIDEARAAAERLADNRLTADEPATRDLAALARQAYDAYNRRDFDELVRMYSSDIVYRPIANFTDNRERRGRADVLRFFEEFMEAWAEDFTTNLDTLRVYGDFVVARVVFRGHAAASGVEITERMFILSRFRDGQIVRIEDFTNRDDALRAAGVLD
jgi:ketosteroid isomerase-like protein